MTNPDKNLLFLPASEPASPEGSGRAAPFTEHAGTPAQSRGPEPRTGLDSRENRLEARETRSRDREAVAGHREEAVALREEVAGLREELLTLREQATRDIERALGELDVRNAELRDANTSLVAATLHAQVMAEVADDARRRQDRFVAMLSHELRNPLEPIRSAVDVLERIGGNDPLLPWVREVIARQVTHMVRLLDDLLDTSRITRGVVKLQRRPVAIGEFVEQAIETYGPLIEQRKQSLTVDLPPEPVYVDGDPIRLAQVVGNLLHNAAKYTQQRGAIALTAKIEGETVALYVKDDGCGISTAVLPRVFDLFAQEDDSLSRSQGGLGIGLAVVKIMAELHGGTVEARSDGAGKGSEFVLRLPRLQHMPAEAAAASARPEPDALGRGFRVLLVDDDADSNDMLAKVLEMAGHDVTKAADGLIAVGRIRDEAPDVVVCDIGLPGLDGYAIAERVRARANGERPILIALTGYGQPEDRGRALAAGFDHHLVKPVSPAMLLQLMAKSQGAVL
jgi:two-component system, sensor histidine kinase